MHCPEFFFRIWLAAHIIDAVNVPSGFQRTVSVFFGRETLQKELTLPTFAGLSGLAEMAVCLEATGFVLQTSCDCPGTSEPFWRLAIVRFGKVVQCCRCTEKYSHTLRLCCKHAVRILSAATLVARFRKVYIWKVHCGLPPFSRDADPSSNNVSSSYLSMDCLYVSSF